MPSSPTSYSSGSVFTVRLRLDTSNRKFFDTDVVAPSFGRNEPSFDLAVVQFADDGSFLDASQRQIEAAAVRIREVRRSSDVHGALVVVFVHGWHHGAEWHRTASLADDECDGDDHFHGFRVMLQSLAYRELERPSAADGSPTGRRIVGIYLTWNGVPQSGVRGVLAKLPGADQTSFRNRYAVAERIGEADDFRESLRRIVSSVKHDPGPESPLVLIGHSMGALMMQSAFATLLEHGALLQSAAAVTPNPTGVTRHGAPVLFPDLVLSLNSAADSEFARRILAAYRKLGLTKVAAGLRVRFNAPLLVSVTSTADSATGVWWPGARAGRSTDGHDSGLITHDLRIQVPPQGLPCLAIQGPDFGQNWHCIHEPHPPNGAATPQIAIDLPTQERKGIADRNVPHDQYVLTPRHGASTPCLQWIFQVPPEVIADHNDIFNSKARSLTLALIQLSGAVASLARDWDDTFVP
jgi:pimeloyl-ACP methyl ester carboxylesterase